MVGEDDIRDRRRQRPAGLGGPGLDDDGPALRRPGDVQRPGHREVPAPVVEPVQLVVVEVDPGRLVVAERVVVEAVPQAGHHLVELRGPPVALLMLDMLGEAEVARLGVVERGDQVPARPSPAEVVQRGERPRQVVRLVVGGGCGRDEPDAGGGGGQRREQGRRFEGVVDHRDPAQHLLVGEGHPDEVGEEERVEAGSLGGPRQFDQVPDVHARVGDGVRVPPGGQELPRGLEEGVEVELPPAARGGHRLPSPAPSRCPAVTGRRPAPTCGRGSPRCPRSVAVS